ncbi:MAG: tryptophan synthase subunit alpha [Anaerolineae bacterium]|nr:tryptophan synthase subunit alpha [Anaerolineae bacterium]
MRGRRALELMFAQTDAQRRPAFLPYYPVGYPDLERSLDAIVAMSRAGVDGFEIGIPFSDPLADGPTIQAATQRSLEQGTTVRDCVAAVRTLRERGVYQPLLLMGYLNPLLAYGVEKFVADIREAGADGLLVPDLPPDEGQEICDIC